jgi:hypothetical protein
MVPLGSAWDSMGRLGSSKDLGLVTGRIDLENPGLVKHLRATPRVTPSHFYGPPIFVFRSCGKLCGSPSAPACRRPLLDDSRENTRQPISRVLSAPVGAGRPFLWDASHDAPHATNPGGGTGTSLRLSRYRDIAAAPIRSCSRWGLPCHPCCQGRGALLPHRFALARGAGPLTPASLAQAVCFLWHCPWGRPRRPLAGTVFPWSPDFPPPAGLPRQQRPSGCLATAMCAPKPRRSSRSVTRAQGRVMIPPPRTRSPS